MGLAFVYISYIALFDAFFFWNAVLIHSCRSFIENHVHNDEDDKEDDFELLRRWQDSENSIVRFLMGAFGCLYLVTWFIPFCIMAFLVETYNLTVARLFEPREDGGNDQKGIQARIIGYFQLHCHKLEAFFLGNLRKENFVVRQFPDWRPLPFNFASFSTTALFIAFAIVFKKSEVGKTTFVSPSEGFCPDAEMDWKVDGLVDRILKGTNVAEALGQTHVTTTYLEALQNDTGRWSTCDHPDALIKDKEAFRRSSVYGREGGLHFFPGVCLAAQKQALDKARTQTCIKNFCAKGSVIDPASIEATPGEITGLDEFQGRIDETKKALRNLRLDCNGCDFGGALKYIFTLGNSKPEPYIAGGGKLMNSIDSLSYTEFGVTNPVVSYSNKTRSFCGNHLVPCPDFSRFDELMEYDSVFLKQNRVAEANEDMMVTDAQQDLEDHVPQEYIDYFERFMLSLQIAGHAFAAYTCLSFLFPLPLKLFKPTTCESIKRLILGVNRKQFFFATLGVYWGYKYLQSVTLIVDLSSLAKIFLLEPCIAREEYSAAIVGNYTAACSSLISAANGWANSRLAVHSIMPIIEAMNHCCGHCPYQSLNQNLFTNESNAHVSVMENYGFRYNVTTGETPFGSGISMYLLDEEPSTFLGNVTFCVDDEFVTREVLGLQTDHDIKASMSWVDMWIWSGWLSSILLTTAIANFGVSLAKLTDPLGAHRGAYEGTPIEHEYTRDRLVEIAKKMDTDLWWSALGGVVFWLILVHLMFLNIVFASTVDLEEESDDAMYPGYILSLAAILFMLGVKYLRESENRDDDGDEVIGA